MLNRIKDYTVASFVLFFLSTVDVFSQTISGESIVNSKGGVSNLSVGLVVVFIPLLTVLIVAVLNNIKRRKIVEAELFLLKKDLEEKDTNTATLIDHLPVAVVVINEDNSIETMNKQFIDYFGYSSTEIRTFDEGWSVLVKDSKYRGAMRRQWDYVVSEVLKSGLEMEPIEFEFQNKVGHDLYCEVCFVPFRDKSLIVFYDITKRKVAESDLQESEALFAAFMENIPGRASLKDTEGQFLYINKRGLSDKNINNASPLRKTVYDLFDKELADSIRIDEKLALETGSVSTVRSFPVNNDDLLWFEELKFKIHRANRPPLIGELSFNITDKKSTSEQLIQAQKMETVGNLAGGLAHDFNNILGGIKGALSMMNFILSTDESVDSERIIGFVDLAENATDRATDMVAQLLSLSQKQEMNFAPVNLNTVIEDVLNVCRTTFPKKVAIHVDASSVDAVVMADRTQLNQVLLNLCVNASHAITIMRDDDSNKSGNLTLVLEKFTADKLFLETHTESNLIDYWSLRIHDTGVGIEKSVQNRIFEPFFSTKGKGKGSGLGLTMVYKIITEHKGFIDVHSERGNGTTISNFRPVLDSLEKVNGDTENSTRVIERGEGTILVIDDEEIIRITKRKILQECGYQVILAKDGIEGLDIFRESHETIDAVILDMSMPNLSGKDTYIRLREIQCSVKVLMGSGFKQDQRVLDSLTLGVDDFIQKTFSLCELASKIKGVLNGPLVRNTDV